MAQRRWVGKQQTNTGLLGTKVLGSRFGFQHLPASQPEPTDLWMGGEGSELNCTVCSGCYGLALGQTAGTGGHLSHQI